MSTDQTRQAVADKLFEDAQMLITAIDGELTKTVAGSTWKNQCWKLEKLKEKELRKWWEATSLQKYMDVARIPRGLRIFTVPTYENPDPLMLKAWREHTHKSSLGMLEILTKFAWSDRDKLLKEIAEIEEILKGNNIDKTQIAEFLTQMDSRLQKIEEDIKQRKARKFRRDRDDYMSGRILTFAKRFTVPRIELSRAQNQRDIPLEESTVYETEPSSEGETSEEDISSSRDLPSGSNLEKIDFLDEHRLLQQANRNRGRGRGKGRDGKTGTRGGKQEGLGRRKNQVNPPARETRSQRGGL